MNASDQYFLSLLQKKSERGVPRTPHPSRNRVKAQRVNIQPLKLYMEKLSYFLEMSELLELCKLIFYFYFENMLFVYALYYPKTVLPQNFFWRVF